MQIIIMMLPTSPWWRIKMKEQLLLLWKRNWRLGYLRGAWEMKNCERKPRICPSHLVPYIVMASCCCFLLYMSYCSQYLEKKERWMIGCSQRSKPLFWIFHTLADVRRTTCIYKVPSGRSTDWTRRSRTLVLPCALEKNGRHLSLNKSPGQMCLYMQNAVNMILLHTWYVCSMYIIGKTVDQFPLLRSSWQTRKKTTSVPPSDFGRKRKDVLTDDDRVMDAPLDIAGLFARISCTVPSPIIPDGSSVIYELIR